MILLESGSGSAFSRLIKKANIHVEKGWIKMSRLKKLLEEDYEKNIEEIIQDFKKSSYVSRMMDPILVSCNGTKQTVTIEFPVLAEQLNEHKTMHAGFIATAFDEALGIFASFLCQGKSSVSINISLNYLKPVPMSDSILVTAKATSLGRRLMTLSGECHLKSNGLLTATALATYAIVG